MTPYLTRHEDWIDRHWGWFLIGIVIAPWAVFAGCAWVLS